jgi:hypothetical protein
MVLNKCDLCLKSGITCISNVGERLMRINGELMPVQEPIEDCSAGVPEPIRPIVFQPVRFPQHDYKRI